MSTYVMSDVHGFYDCFLEFLQYSNFNNNDTLYIIGDVLDRGNNAIDIILDITERDNVHLIKGNHELMMLPIFNDLMYQDKNIQKEIIEAELNIQQIGQKETLESFITKDNKTQNKITNFLADLPLYKEINVNNTNYILVHGGLSDREDTPLEYYDENSLLFGPHMFERQHFDNNTTIIVGHLPTRFIAGAIPDKISYFHNTIAIDCGLGFGGQLGVLCLDTMEEMYF